MVLRRFRKGESTTRQLIMYELVLLAIVVGGLLYIHILSSKECIEVIDGFDDPGVALVSSPQYVLESNGDFKFFIRNMGGSTVIVKRIIVNGKLATISQPRLDLGQISKVVVNIGPQKEGSCKELRVVIVYDVNIGGAINEANSSGTIIAKVQP